KPALQQAGLFETRSVDRARIGVYLGAGEGKQDFYHVIPAIAGSPNGSGGVDTPRFAEIARRTFDAAAEKEQEMHTVTGHVAEHFALDGPNYSCLTACAASSQAIGEAADLIRRGEVDVMVAGGAHSMIHPFGVTGFNLLTALSTHNELLGKASCPFDLRRDGFVMGEGAGIVILEDLEHARRRGAEVLAELTGYGTTADAFRVTDSHPEGRGAIACIKGALTDAGLQPEDIGYINAHGTSTQVNDRVETVAIKHVFGAQAKNVPVSSSKSMLGHLIAAAGAVELIICVMALRRGILPPTINYEVPDPELDLDYIPNQAREKRVRHVMSNSFGFGGQNVALIVSQFAA
ncbi:MAG TPA: beta-ketoacyl-[acyl-carrier-protein] synthase family protein, partial [Gemmatales bacterium]|nr:beta-ketoacyl-[acyl-carrier-protein] synthase family protein [Gemmatales bacterium]